MLLRPCACVCVRVCVRATRVSGPLAHWHANGMPLVVRRTMREGAKSVPGNFGNFAAFARILPRFATVCHTLPPRFGNRAKVLAKKFAHLPQNDRNCVGMKIAVVAMHDAKKPVQTLDRCSLRANMPTLTRRGATLTGLVPRNGHRRGVGSRARLTCLNERGYHGRQDDPRPNDRPHCRT